MIINNSRRKRLHYLRLQSQCFWLNKSLQLHVDEIQQWFLEDLVQVISTKDITFVDMQNI